MISRTTSFRVCSVLGHASRDCSLTRSYLGILTISASVDDRKVMCPDNAITATDMSRSGRQSDSTSTNTLLASSVSRVPTVYRVRETECGDMLNGPHTVRRYGIDLAWSLETLQLSEAWSAVHPIDRSIESDDSRAVVTFQSSRHQIANNTHLILLG